MWGAWALYLYEDCIPRFAQYARRIWGVAEADDAAAAKAGIDATVAFFRSIGMPATLGELGIEPTEEDMQALALDATMNDTLQLSRIRPLDAADIAEIYRRAL